MFEIGEVAAGRRYFIDGSDARIGVSNDEAALPRLWREKRGELAPQDRSGNLVVQLGVDNEKLHQRYKVDSGEAITDVQRPVQHPASPCIATTLDGTKTFVSPVRAAHAEFVAALLGNSPRPIPVDVDAVDLEDRADHLNKMLNSVSVYVAAILDDTAQNVPGGLNLHQIDALLSDLTSDVTGTIQRAADAMAERAA